MGLSELIALGLKNNRRLVERRGDITIAEARERAAHDWPDPQLRFRKTWGFNDVPPPYTERREESFTDRVTRTEVNEDGERERTTSTESINRTTDRTVTPGRDSEVIQENSSESSRQNTRSQSGNSTDIQNSFRSGTREDFHEYDPFASEDELTVQLRFYLPHPKQRKAQIERARREIALARAQTRAEEREVVLEIREMYEELQFLQTQIALQKSGGAAAAAYDATQRRLFEAKLITIDELEFVAGEGFDSMLAQFEFENLRGRLAAQVGLLDETRIRVTDRLVSPALSLGVSDLPYLIEMAFANREEIATANGNGLIAEADLAAAEAELMPWFDYIQAGFGRSEQGGIQTDTSWSVQFAMSIPVFSWFGHEREIYEAAIASYYAQKEASKGIITGEVTAAYKAVQRSSRLRASARSFSMKQKKRNDEFLAAFEGMEELQYAETRYDMARATARTDEQRLKAERTYNRALINLEAAIGAPLDRVFGGGSKSGDLEVTAASADAGTTPPPPATEKKAVPPAPKPPVKPAAEKTAEPSKPRTLLERLRSPDEDRPRGRPFGKRRL